MTEASNPTVESWPKRRLADIANILMGQSPPSSTYNESGLGVPFLQGKAEFGRVHPAAAKWCSSPARLAPANSILVSVRAPVGDVNLADREYCIGRGLAAIVCGENCDPVFVFEALGYAKPQLEAYGSGTTFQSINRGTLDNFELALPSLEDQRVIASVLRAMRQTMEATIQVITATRVLKRALMRHLFAYGPIRVAESDAADVRLTDIGPLPRHWKLSSLGDVARVERGKFSHRPRNDPAFYGGLYPFIQTGDVTAAAIAGRTIGSYSQTLNERGLKVSRVFPRGTIAITIAANIGYTAILDFDSAFPDSIIAITPDAALSNEFLNYYLATQQEEMDHRAPRGTQKNINIQFLRPWPVPVPPPAEQRAISETLAAVDAKLAAERERLASVTELFKAALAELMSGGRRPLRGVA